MAKMYMVPRRYLATIIAIAGLGTIYLCFLVASLHAGHCWFAFFDHAMDMKPHSQNFEYAVRHSRRFENEFIIVAHTNLGMLNLTTNWLISLHLAGVDIRLPLLICFDHQSFKFLRELGLNAFEITPNVLSDLKINPLNTSTSFTRYGTNEYKDIVKLKMSLNSLIARFGVPFIFSDVDTVLLRHNPHNAFTEMVKQITANRSNGTSILIQSDNGKDGKTNLCTGLYIALSDFNTQNMFARVMADMETSKGNDQDSFNKVCHEVDCQKFVGVLNPQHFVRGKDFFNNQNPFLLTPISLAESQNETVPYIVHANWMMNADKIPSLKKFKLWFIETPQLLQLLAPDPSFIVALP